VTTKGERTRRRILEVVVHLLETRSFGEISIAEITRRAEVTRPAFYFHFPTKGAVVAAVLEDLLDEFVGVAAAWYEHPGDDPASGVAEALAATVDLWRANARLMDAMVRAAAVDEEAAQLVGAWEAHLTERATDRLRRDLGPRLASGSPSVESLAQLLVGATFDAMRRDVRSIVGSGEPRPEVAAALAHVWLRVVTAGR
jgi:AcrR family transcriptional regulator